MIEELPILLLNKDFLTLLRLVIYLMDTSVGTLENLPVRA